MPAGPSQALTGPGGPDPSGPPGESGKWGRSSLTDRGEFPRPKLIVNLMNLALPLCPEEEPSRPIRKPSTRASATPGFLVAHNTISAGSQHDLSGPPIRLSAGP